MENHVESRMTGSPTIQRGTGPAQGRAHLLPYLGEYLLPFEPLLESASICHSPDRRTEIPHGRYRRVRRQGEGAGDFAHHRLQDRPYPYVST